MDGDGGGCRPHINRFTCAQVHITEKKIAIPTKEQPNKTKQNKKTKQEKQPIETREGGKARDKVIFGSD